MAENLAKNTLQIENVNRQNYFSLMQSLENARSGAKFFKLLKEALNEGYPVDYAPEGYPTLLYTARENTRDFPLKGRFAESCSPEFLGRFTSKNYMRR